MIYKYFCGIVDKRIPQLLTGKKCRMMEKPFMSVLLGLQSLIFHFSLGPTPLHLSNGLDLLLEFLSVNIAGSLDKGIRKIKKPLFPITSA